MWKKIFVLFLLLVLLSSEMANGQAAYKVTYYGFSKGDFAEWRFDEMTFNSTIMDNCNLENYTCHEGGIGTINQSNVLRVEVLKDYDFQGASEGDYIKPQFWDYFSVTLENGPIPSEYMVLGFNAGFDAVKINLNTGHDELYLETKFTFISFNNEYPNGTIVNAYVDYGNSTSVRVVNTGDIISYKQNYTGSDTNGDFLIAQSSSFDATTGILQHFISVSKYLNVSISLSDSSITIPITSNKFPVGSDSLLVSCFVMLSITAIIVKSKRRT